VNPTTKRRVDLAIILLFVVMGLFTLIVGWRTLSGVRETAYETDRRIRTLAFAVLAYASEYGQFPMSNDELQAFGLGPDEIAVGSTKNEWPSKRDVAQRGEATTSLDESLHSILIVYGDHRGMPPYLKPDGLPTKNGTGPEVNSWLEAFGRGLSGK
jgi:hypothetical protein